MSVDDSTMVWGLVTRTRSPRDWESYRRSCRIVDAVHSGELAKAEYETFGTFGLQIPATALDGVPCSLLIPRLVWKDKETFEREARKFGGMFTKAFALYERDADKKVRTAGSSCESGPCGGRT